MTDFITSFVFLIIFIALSITFLFYLISLYAFPSLSELFHSVLKLFPSLDLFFNHFSPNANWANFSHHFFHLLYQFKRIVRHLPCFLISVIFSYTIRITSLELFFMNKKRRAFAQRHTNSDLSVGDKGNTTNVSELDVDLSYRKNGKVAS